MTTERMDIGEIEESIAQVYRFFAEQAPGVTPKEDGTLGALWALADQYYATESEA